MTIAMTAAAPAATLRAFVSGVGNDSNTASNCAHAAPCRTFAAALTVISPRGEIEALDPAGYGPITINGPLSIVGVPGAAINAPSGGAGIIINAQANEAVHLQGLLIDGSGVGTTGIQFNSGGSLVVENCVIRNLTNDGINVYNSTATVQVLISNTLVADNGFYGIFIFPRTAGSATATFNRVKTSKNFAANIILEGDQTTGTVRGTAIDSVAVGSTSSSDGSGFEAFGAQAELNLFSSVASHNRVGVTAGGGGGTVRLYQTMVTGNTVGWNGGTVMSYVNNSIDDNGCCESPPGSVLPLK